jgi:hypothetical protein
MDVIKTIKDLRDERDRLDRLIRRLEQAGQNSSKGGEARRRAVTPAQRRKAAERMREYWARRKGVAPETGGAPPSV